MINIEFKNDELISIIINCHNSEAYLLPCLQSVLDQDYKNIEILIIDNASTDRTAEIIQNFTDKRIRYIYLDKLIPLYHARNIGLEKFQGQYVCFLDSDDLMTVDRLSSQIKFIKSIGADIIFSDYCEIDSNGQMISKSMVGNKAYKNITIKSLLKSNFISVGAIFAKGNLLKSNYFDPNLLLMGDFELWIRLLKFQQIVYHPHIVELSRKHSASTSIKNQKKWLGEKVYVLNKILRSQPKQLFSISAGFFVLRALISHFRGIDS